MRGSIQLIDAWMLQHGICSLLNKESLLFIEKSVPRRPWGSCGRFQREGKLNRSGSQRRDDRVRWKQDSGRKQGTLQIFFFFLLSLKWLDQFSRSFIFFFTFYNESKNKRNIDYTWFNNTFLSSNLFLQKYIYDYFSF